MIKYKFVILLLKIYIHNLIMKKAIKIKLYTKESKEINSTYVSIGKAKKGKYILDEESANIIYSSIKNTLKDTEKNYLYCSFLIQYEKNGVNSTLEKNNVNINVKQNYALVKLDGTDQAIVIVTKDDAEV